MIGGASAAGISVRAEHPVDTGRVPWLEAPFAGSFPWLTAGITRGGEKGADMGLFGEQPVGSVLGRWRMLREDTGFPTILHSRQVHGGHVLRHNPIAPGFHLAVDADGHCTEVPGLLLTVSVADCVPILLVRSDSQAVAVLHAGWRGVAAGVLENGLAALRGPPGPATVRVHLGPAICGNCYEVGPEVHAALGLPEPAENTPVDLRAVLAERAARAGVPAESITRSPFCTRCDAAIFFSHRGGQAGRQIAFIGIRPGA